MTPEEASKIRKGDMLKAQFVAASDGLDFDGEVWVEYGGGVEWTTYLKPAAILSVTPAPREIKVGDRVKADGDRTVYTVRGFDGEEVWLKRPDGGNAWSFRRDLRHADTTEPSHD